MIIIDKDIHLPRMSKIESTWTYLYAEGNDLNDLLQDATVYASDRDGNEVGSALISDLDDNLHEFLADFIRSEYIKMITPEGFVNESK